MIALDHLVQGAMASLRSLLRHCARLRAALTDPNDSLLPNLNILIAITGGFFGQVRSHCLEGPSC